MRARKTTQGLTVNAIAGTHVVFLGLNLSAERRKGCLGFAIQREDHTENEKYWMSGTKTFEATDPGVGPGGQVSSHEHPLQTFQWADYSAKPEHDYTYTVVPLYGTPQHLVDGDDCAVTVATESEWGKPHSVLFNRGAIASQEYARRFQNQDPDQVGAAAYTWLSRGLFEAFVAFLARAVDEHWSIHGAIYEFQWPAALQAVKDARGRGAEVAILYDGIPGASGPKAKNEAAIAAAKIKSLCQPRSLGKIMHNKFFVLAKDGKAKAVWTGSTNLTENGIFGHSNLGHAVEDADLATAYLDYWNELAGNPDAAAERTAIAALNPSPPAPWSDDLTHVFSPHSGLKVLDWYAEIAGSAKKTLMMTFAFGMDKRFQQVYEQNDSILRFALMEKEGNGAGLAQGKIDVTRIRKLPNVVVAVGNNIVSNSFDRWLAEKRSLSAESNVRYIHTKYMLVDPLSDSPIVVTGSANFSQASTNANHENVLVIRGDTRVADIYLGEFMRLYSHYAFREAAAIAKKKGETNWRPQYLIPSVAWQSDYYRPGGQRSLRRTAFA